MLKLLPILAVFITSFYLGKGNYERREVKVYIAGLSLPSNEGSKVAINQTASPKPYTKTGIEKLVCDEFKDECDMALAIFRAESGLNPDAVSSSGDFGISQIHLASHAGKIPGSTREEKIAWLKVPENNIKLAKRIRNSSGWWAWSAYKNNHYLAFLKL